MTSLSQRLFRAAPNTTKKTTNSKHSYLLKVFYSITSPEEGSRFGFKNVFLLLRSIISFNMASKCVSAFGVDDNKLLGTFSHSSTSSCSGESSNGSSSRGHRVHQGRSDFTSSCSHHSKAPSKYAPHDLNISRSSHHSITPKKYATISDPSSHDDSHHHGRSSAHRSRGGSIGGSSHHERRSTDPALRRPPCLRVILGCLIGVSFWRTAQCILEANQQVSKTLEVSSQVATLAETTNAWTERISAMMLDGSFFDNSIVFWGEPEINRDFDHEDAPDSNQLSSNEHDTEENKKGMESLTSPINENGTDNITENRPAEIETWDKGSNKDLKVDDTMFANKGASAAADIMFPDHHLQGKQSLTINTEHLRRRR